MSETIVGAYNLFPISKESAEIGLAMFNNGLDLTLREELMLDALRNIVHNNNPSLLSSLSLTHAFLIRAMQVQVFGDQSLDVQQSAKEEGQRIIKSYSMGVVCGYSALSAEAKSRYGRNLPILPDEIIETWMSDEGQRLKEATLLAFKFMETLDENPTIALDKFLTGGEMRDKINKYRSTFVYRFYQRERVLGDTIDRYAGNDHFPVEKVVMSSVAQGIYHICSVFQAHLEVQQLRTQFS